MKIFILGTGFVSDHLNYTKITDRVTNSINQIKYLIEVYKPDVLINCIGKTGRPNIDWCENNKEITCATNTALPIMLAEACAERNIHLIQIGSGCIFFGESPNFNYLQGDGSPMPNIKTYPLGGPNYEPFMARAFSLSLPAKKIDLGWKEDDFANPKSTYSKSKYACDLALGGMKNVTTLRIRMPISDKNNQRNLINKLKGYESIINIPNSVTFMSDLARCVDWVIKERKFGTFHVTNPQPLTAVQIMNEYQKYVPNHKFNIISEVQLEALTKAKRSNCILNTDKLLNAGFTMTPTHEALQKCMSEYITNIGD